MTDRFYGNITIGGQVTKEQFKALIALVDPLLEMDGTIEQNGQASFHECNSKDFADLIQYVEEQKIALQLYWDAGHECDAHCEVWLNGKYKQFNTDGEGNIVVRVSDLEEHENMFICDFIKSLDIPDFPAFELIEDVPKKIQEYEFKTATRHGVIAARSWDEAKECLTQMLADNPEDWGWVEDKDGQEFKIGEAVIPTEMRTVTVYFSDGDTITTDINGTNEEISKHYLGQRFEAGSDTKHHVALCVRFHDLGSSLGLMCKNIESGHKGMIHCVRRETTKVDDTRSFDSIMLTLLTTEYSLDDVWVYDLNGEWLKTVGYKYETAR